MHMADALISPLVGGTMLAATIGALGYSINKLKEEADDHKIPLMGVMGAFVFASQMINFTIPGTGSSGHIGGGLLLAILLGPYAGFLTLASVLLIQALIFGDGGLLAYGCNVFNLGFYTCFLVYPLIFDKIMKKGFNTKKLIFVCLISAIIGLQFGAFSVVLETLLSGKTELPFGTFALLMQPIHLAIGLVEGLVTASVITFVWKARPELIYLSQPVSQNKKGAIGRIGTLFIVMTLIIGGVISSFASENPDGLEWAMFKTTGTGEIEENNGIHRSFEKWQEMTTILPDYQFETDHADGENGKPTVIDIGTSASGVIGGVITLAFVTIIGFIINALRRK